MLIAALENRIYDLASEEGEELVEYSLSGQAHWLIQKSE